MFEEAEKEGLWFFCNYQQLWFTPGELREKHKKGEFVWGRTNWKLRNPQELLDGLERDKQFIEDQIDEVRERIGKGSK